MGESGTVPNAANGAVILREVVSQLYGNFGAVMISLIFTLACLTTCVGLITSIAQYFSTILKKVSYKQMVLIITLFSFVICNLGLNAILAISIPVLNAIYPISIVLILLGLFNFLYKDNRFIYPITIASTGIISFIYALDELKVPYGAFKDFLSYIPGYNLGFGWVIFAGVSIVISLILGLIFKNMKPDQEENIVEEL